MRRRFVAASAIQRASSEVSEISGPVPRMEVSDLSEPVSKFDGSDLSQPVDLLTDDVLETRATTVGEIDRPVVHRPIHVVDEVTPPAVDVEDLRREIKPS